MRAERVLETCLYAEELDAAERFYREVMGLELIARMEDRHLFFRCGAGVFLVFNPLKTLIPDPALNVGSHGARGAGHVAFAARADELPAWRAQLARHGVAIESEIDWPQGGHSIYFRDPAGNNLELATPAIWGLPEN